MTHQGWYTIKPRLATNQPTLSDKHIWERYENRFITHSVMDEIVSLPFLYKDDFGIK